MADGEPGSAGVRLPTLTAMRFFAAFLVFTSHCCSLGYFGPSVTAALGRYALASGYAGVEFFFVLSGFVLTWSARDRDTPGRFWRRRFVKIYPNHFVTWTAALVLALLAGDTVTPSRVVPSLFLVHTWVPNLYVSASINVPSWTLSCELLFYLLFPSLHDGIRRIAPAGLWWWVAGVVALIVLVPVAVHMLVPGPDLSTAQRWLTMSFPPTRLLEFVLGILLARLVRTGGWVRVPLSLAVPLVIGGFAEALLLAPTVFGVTLPLIAPLAVLITAGAGSDVRRTPSVLRAGWLVWLGDLSYAFYLVHYLVLIYGHDLFGYTRTWPVPTALAILAGLLAVALALSWVLYTVVERPCLRRWGAPRRVLAPAV